MAKKLGPFQVGAPFAALLILVLILAGVIFFQLGKMAPSGLEYISEEEFNKIKSEAEAAKAIIDPEKSKRKSGKSTRKSRPCRKSNP